MHGFVPTTSTGSRDTGGFFRSLASPLAKRRTREFNDEFRACATRRGEVMQRVFSHAGLGQAGHRRHRIHRLIALALTACGCASSSLALANNVGENTSWQF
eukprot:gene37755-49449_t